MKILGVEHVAIAAESLEEGAPFWRDILGIPHGGIEILESEGVSTHIYDTGKGKIELLVRHGDDSPISKFLKKRGPALHHVCLEVEDIASAVEELKEKGIRLINDVPRQGVGGYSVAFVHPESTGGILVELCQKS
ncbi:MAG: methylmalonyl-CoA epimerase [Fidelibacterota bacterium]